jgi:ribosomal protein S18 acetylase RimI-like enzyme
LWEKNTHILGPPLPLFNFLKSNPKNEFFLVIDEVAFIHFRVKLNGNSSLYNIAVAEDHKKKGYGKFLISLLPGEIELKTDRDNIESNSFYSRLGFICMGKKITKSGKIVNIYRR